MYVNLQDLNDNLDREFSPLFAENKPSNEEKIIIRENQSQPPSQSPYDPDPLRVTRPERQPTFPDYGRSDLDPFGNDPFGNIYIFLLAVI